MKVCNLCKKWKHESDFERATLSQCKACRHQYRNARRNVQKQREPEAFKAKQRIYNHRWYQKKKTAAIQHA